jgi:hypothetical protein
MLCSVCVCVCVSERERVCECVCVYVSENGNKQAHLYQWVEVVCKLVCLCEYVCVFGQQWQYAGTTDGPVGGSGM